MNGDQLRDGERREGKGEGGRGRGEGPEGPPDTRPYLSIPYWSRPVTGATDPWDTGEGRPLPGGVVYYLCESIHPGRYRPGEVLEVAVDVRNSGGGNAASVATVVVYWADPSSGFASPRFFAATTVTVPPSRTAPTSVRTPTMRARIPDEAPAHICLLVMVSHPQDKAPTAFDPVGDRHWAQRNLTAVSVAPGAPAVTPFVVANPFDREGEFLLVLAAADRRRTVLVAEAIGAEPAWIDATVRLLDEEGAPLGEGGAADRVRLGLGPREARRVQAFVEVGEELPRGAAATFEALLFDASLERVVGALGFTLTAPEG